MRAEVRAFADEVGPLGDEAARERLIETGYLMPHWPKPWGRAASAVEQLVIDEELTRAGIVIPDYGIAAWVVLTLVQHGTPDQVERWVLPALRREHEWCQLFSEPDAGSDAAGVTTRGERVEGGWIVNGQKVWTSGGTTSDLGLATVRTDPSAPKHKGVSTFVIDMHAPGVEARPLRQVDGAEDFSEVFLTDVFVPDDDVVGDIDRGWTVARATLGNERVSIGAGAGGGLGIDFDWISLLDEHPDRAPGVVSEVARLLATEQAQRLLDLRRAARAVAGGEPGPEGNVTKLVLAELSHRASQARARARGGCGCVRGRARRSHGDDDAAHAGHEHRRRDLGDHPQPDRRTAARPPPRPAPAMTLAAGLAVRGCVRWRPSTRRGGAAWRACPPPSSAAARGTRWCEGT